MNKYSARRIEAPIEKMKTAGARGPDGHSQVRRITAFARAESATAHNALIFCA
jgi:hypothetical protein